MFLGLFVFCVSAVVCLEPCKQAFVWRRIISPTRYILLYCRPYAYFGTHSTVPGMYRYMYKRHVELPITFEQKTKKRTLLIVLFFFLFFFFHLTYSRWTTSLPSCLWSQRIFPSLPGSRLTIFYRDASSALLQLVNQWLNFTYSRSHAFRVTKEITQILRW